MNNSLPEPPFNSSRPRDWRVIMGILITLCWLSAGAFYLIYIVGFEKFLHLSSGDIGSFLEGAFAPLAFLWLVIGYFIQHSELSANTDALRLQETHSRRLELNSRRDSYFKLMELVSSTLGVVCGFLYFSIEGPTGTGKVSYEKFSEDRTTLGSGDYGLFVRKMLFLCVEVEFDKDKLEEFFYGTEIRQRHTNNFTKTYEKLLKAAEEVDYDDMICNAIELGSASGRLYNIIRELKNKEDHTRYY